MIGGVERYSPANELSTDLFISKCFPQEFYRWQRNMPNCPSLAKHFHKKMLCYSHVQNITCSLLTMFTSATTPARLRPLANRWANLASSHIHTWHPSIIPAKLPTAAAGHKFRLVSLHNTYPATKRSQENSILTVLSHLSRRIISTQFSSSSNENSQSGTHCNTELQSYLRYIQCGDKLSDGIIGMQPDAVIAVQPTRSNFLPWFARVVQVNLAQHEVQVKWLHRHEQSSKYFYQDDTIDVIHEETIICNGIDLQPVFGEKLMWKLLTPLLFIQALNQDQPVRMTENWNIATQPSAVKYDLIELMFEDEQDFRKFATSL